MNYPMPVIPVELQVDPVVASIAVRLADEGVPIRAIARSTKVPSSDVYDLLKDARERGEIVELPKDDWPVGMARAQRVTLAGTPLDTDEGLSFAFARCFKATRLEAAVLVLMLRRNDVTKEQVHHVIEQSRTRKNDNEETDIKMVDVVICHIRKKLKARAITVETVWGIGYRFGTTDRAMIMGILTDFVTGAGNV